MEIDPAKVGPKTAKLLEELRGFPGPLGICHAPTLYLF